MRVNNDEKECVAERHHYVSKFHLRGFTDLDGSSPEPWLWLGNLQDLSVRRRSPKNVGWERGTFGVPGGLEDREAQLESFLSEEVESPAALAIRKFAAQSPGCRGEIPSEIGRYIAWAAARSISMRSLYEAWLNKHSITPALVEPPVTGMEKIKPDPRSHRMEHPRFGQRIVPSGEVDELRAEGWQIRLGQQDFAELVHLQAWYFQERFFPRLQWLVLDVPKGGFFVIGDRPVVWGFQDEVNSPPSVLRHPNVQLFAPLTRSVALMASGVDAVPTQVAYSDVNAATSRAASNWIAGSTEEIVSQALSARTAG